MNKASPQATDWKNSNINVFWGEIAPCDHLVQFYENDQVFINTLASFAGNGFLSGDNVVVIATNEHLGFLDSKLGAQGFDPGRLASANSYFPLDAHEALAEFMVNDWPDEALFEEYITRLITRASEGNKKVRAFGEMVAILWQEGHCGATVKLEHLWCKLHEKKKFCLYCAYPKNGFTQSPGDSMDTICKTHSRIIHGQATPSTEIYYKPVK